MCRCYYTLAVFLISSETVPRLYLRSGIYFQNKNYRKTKVGKKTCASAEENPKSRRPVSRSCQFLYNKKSVSDQENVSRRRRIVGEKKLKSASELYRLQNYGESENFEKKYDTQGQMPEQSGAPSESSSR